jgi:hypothetical protein
MERTPIKMHATAITHNTKGFACANPHWLLPTSLAQGVEMLQSLLDVGQKRIGLMLRSDAGVIA